MSAKRHIITICIGAAGLLAPLSSSAATTSDKECAEEILMTYYPESFVAETLEKFKVPKSQQPAIISALVEKDHEVIPMVEERAAKMNPNPLRDPQHRQQAVKIFRDSLYDIFAQVMQAHGINDREEIESMLDDIQQQKARAFAACRERYRDEQHSNGGNSNKQNFTRKPNGGKMDQNNEGSMKSMNQNSSPTNYRKGY